MRVHHVCFVQAWLAAYPEINPPDGGETDVYCPQHMARRAGRGTKRSRKELQELRKKARAADDAAAHNAV